MARYRFLSSWLIGVLLAAGCGPAASPRFPLEAPGVRGQPASEEGSGSSPASSLSGALTGPVLRVHFIDVGQGDAALIQTPGGRNVLIDSGPSRSKRHLLDYLEALGVRQIDLAINTHPHEDHVGGLLAVIERLDVKRVLLSGYVHTTSTYEKLIGAYESNRIPIKLARRGRTIKLDEQIFVVLLAPEDPLLTDTRSDANANSVIFRLSYGEIDFLFAGDAEHETEERVLSNAHEPDSLEAEFLKVAHHGSKYASSDTFLTAVGPKFAVISASSRNRYGHPAPETIERLRRRGTQILETFRLGNIIASTDGRHVKIAVAPNRGDPHTGVQPWTVAPDS